MGYVYSFLNFKCSINGPGGSVVLGDGAGTAEEGISFEPSSEINTMQIGADGAGQHSLHADISGKVIVRILKTSPTNQALMAMYNAQTTNPASHGQNTISGTDVLRGDSITASQVAFAKAPSIHYGKEAGMNDWEFHAIQINRKLGT